MPPWITSIDTAWPKPYIHYMVAFLPEHIIDQVRQASDIVEVLSEFLPLKKRGRNYVCTCPFHHEKTPSFSVSRDKQIFHCFGCGKGGNVLSFLMEHEQMAFPEAVKFLAKRAGIQLPESRQSQRDTERFSRLYYANEQASFLYRKSLASAEAGKKVLDYLHKARGMTDDTINEFQIGYAPEGWENLISYAKNKQITLDELLAAGLVIKRESGSGYYDRFRQRLMFPILDLSRRVIGFGARALTSGDTVKYLNSPETPLYNKSRVLYGLNHTRAEIRTKREALIVEGYMDLISLYQVGLRNAVAVSGTSFTRDHALLLKRYADTVHLMFDADPAGQSAAERCAVNLFSVGIDVRVTVLPEGDDPDSFVRSEGREKVEDVIKGSVSYFQFVKMTADPPFERRNRMGQQMLVKSQLRLAGLASDEVTRALMLKELSDLYEITEESLVKGMEAEVSTERVPAQPRYSAVANRPGLERSILALLISHPPLLDSASDVLKAEWFSQAEYQSIYRLMLMLREEGRATDIASLIDKIADETVLATLTSLMNDGGEPSDWETAFAEYLRKLKTAHRDDRIRTYTRQLQEAEKSGDTEEVRDLLDKINFLRSES
jgi:DNA primase